MTGTFTQGYVAPDGETPQTAGDVSEWFGIDKNQSLSLTLAGEFGATTVIRLQSTTEPVAGSIKTVADLTAAATTYYAPEKNTWYRVYFLTQDGSEEITYTLAIKTETATTFVSPTTGATIMTITDTAVTLASGVTLALPDTTDGNTYTINPENGVLTPVEV